MSYSIHGVHCSYLYGLHIGNVGRVLVVGRGGRGGGARRGQGGRGPLTLAHGVQVLIQV